MIEYTPADADYLHSAFQDAVNDAIARAEKGMTLSADSYREQAANVKRLRNCILATMPELVGMSYPNSSPPDSSSSNLSAAS